MDQQRASEPDRWPNPDSMARAAARGSVRPDPTSRWTETPSPGPDAAPAGAGVRSQQPVRKRYAESALSRPAVARSAESRRSKPPGSKPPGSNRRARTARSLRAIGLYGATASGGSAAALYLSNHPPMAAAVSALATVYIALLTARTAIKDQRAEPPRRDAG